MSDDDGPSRRPPRRRRRSRTTAHGEPADEPIANPGLPDARVAADRRRPEGREARRAPGRDAASALSTVCAVLFVVSYFAFDDRRRPRTPIGGLGASNVALGLPSAWRLLFIGIGMIQWARKLMGDHEIVEMRHPAALLRRGPRPRPSRSSTSALEESGIGRRPLVRNSLLGARRPARPARRRAAARPRPDLQRPDDSLPGAGSSTRSGSKGMRVVRDVVGTPIQPGDLEIGDLVNAEPEAIFDGRRGRRARCSRASTLQVAKSKGAVILRPDGPRRHHPGQGRENWAVDGILCYSKICTHVGCPISLYERTTHHLLCPCHQSTFDLADAAKVIFGPAARPLPQLPHHGGRRGLPRGAERLQRTRRTQLLGA